MTILDLVDTCRKHNVDITVSCEGPITIRVKRGDCWFVQDIYIDVYENHIADYTVQQAIEEMIEEIDYEQNL